MRFRQALLIASLSPAISLADEPLVTDRPDFTESTQTIARGRFQVEAGMTFTDAEEVEVRTFGEVLVRIGLGARTELRVGLPSLVDVDAPGAANADVSALEDSSIGLKLRLHDDDDERLATPSLSVLLATTLPTGSSALRQPHPQPAAVVAAAWDLSPRLSLGSNLGLTYASADGEQFLELAGSVAAGWALDDRWGLFLEGYGFVPQDRGGAETYYVNGGVTRLLGNDLQLDFRLGTGLDSAADDFFVGLGVGWRH